MIDCYERVQRGDAFASDCLAEQFRRHPELGARARAIAARRLFGFIHRSRTIDFALEHAAGRLARRTTKLARYLALCLLEHDMTVPDARTALPVVEWQVVASINKRIAAEPSPARRLALSASLPDFLAERLLNEYGTEAEPLALALNQSAPPTIRVNTLKSSRVEFVRRLNASNISARPTQLAPSAVLLEEENVIYSDAAPILSGLRNEGFFEPQDEGSQLIAVLVDAQPGQTVVDVCAGAGGKTLALGASLANRGQLVALTLGGPAENELRRRVRRAGLTNVRVIPIERDAWPDAVNAQRGKADRVLVDAPCSGVGSLRRKPEARWRLTEDALRRLPGEQLAILRRAADLCAPGGRLVYATCTVLADENERVVERFLASDSRFELLSARDILREIAGPKAADLCDAAGRTVKLYPHRHGTDGFFAAVLKAQ